MPTNITPKIIPTAYKGLRQIGARMISVIIYKRRRYHLYFWTCSKIKALPGLVISGEKSKYPNNTFVCKKPTINIKRGRTPQRIPKILHKTEVLNEDISVKPSSLKVWCSY